MKIKIGENVTLWGKIYLNVENKGAISIGNNCTIVSGEAFNPLCSNVYCSINVVENAKLSIGDWSGISGGCIWATDSITIGSHVNIGANCIVMDGDIHNNDWRLRRDNPNTNDASSFKHKPVVIEDDVWLGANCIVLKGVTIVARSIIGAGSVVTKSIPADSIAAGNPCKVIKHI